MVGLGGLLAQPCALALHFASQDVLVYPAPHDDPPQPQPQPQPQRPPPGPDTTLSGVVELTAPADRTLAAIRITLRGTQILALHDPTRFEQSSTFARTIEINAENYARSSSSAAARHDPPPHGSTADAGIFLPRGVSYFAFTFILPATLAPTTRSKHARIRYTCTATAIAGGRARSNVSSPPREIYVLPLPQPDAEGSNAAGMPHPVPLDVQFHDFHDALGILSVSLTSLSLTVGAIATLSIYHPAPPPGLSVHLVRVTLEQTIELYNRTRRSWIRMPVDKFRLWDAGHMPFKKIDDQPIRPRTLGTVTAALTPGSIRPVDTAPTRRAGEWEDSIWLASSDGAHGRPGNAILDRLYVNPAEAAAAAAHAALEDPPHARRDPDESASSYFGSRPASPAGHARLTRSVPTTPGSASRPAHGGGGGSSLEEWAASLDVRPHPDPLFATACDHPTMPYLSAISGAWTDRPLPTSPQPSPADGGPNAYRLRALLRLPSDDTLHPTTLRGSRADVHFSHEVAIEVFFSRAHVLSEERGKEGRPKLQVFSMRKNVVVQSCAVTPDMVHLPPYVSEAHDPEALPPTYMDATSQPPTRPSSPHASASSAHAQSAAPSSGRPGGTASPIKVPAQRGRPGFFRRLSGPASHPTSSGASSDAHEQEQQQQSDGSVPQPRHASSHSHLRNTLSSILHPHSHSHHQQHGPRAAAHHVPAKAALRAAGGTGAHGAEGAGNHAPSIAAAASSAWHQLLRSSSQGLSAGGGSAIQTATATAPPSRAPSRAVSRESSPTRLHDRGSSRSRTESLGGILAVGSTSAAGLPDGGSSEAGELAESTEAAAAAASHSNDRIGHGQPPAHAQPKAQQLHHHRRNDFAFGFTPSSARRGEGQDADSSRTLASPSSGRQSPAHGRHAHFIPAQVIGRDRGDKVRAGSVSGTDALGGGPGPVGDARSSEASSASGSGSGRLSRRSSAGDSLNGTFAVPTGASEGSARALDAGSHSSASPRSIHAASLAEGPHQHHRDQATGEAPTPARLENALRQLQLRQADALRAESRGGGGGVGGPVPSNVMNPAPSSTLPSTPQSREAFGRGPGSGTLTPGGTLVTSGPNLPPEWNLVMSPGERTSVTHSTCMCGRTTESLLRAERLLLVGMPTAPYFTPSASRPPTPGATQRMAAESSPFLSSSPYEAAEAAGSLGQAAADLRRNSEREPHHARAMLPLRPSSAAALRADSADTAPAPLSRSLSYGGRADADAVSLPRATTPGPGPSFTSSNNIGADDPEGVLWAAGMGADGRPGAAAAAASSTTTIQQHEASGAGAGRTADEQGLGTLESLMPADEFVLARGRDPDEILRRKAELMMH